MCEMNRFVIRSNKRVCINNIITTNSISYYRHLDKVTKGRNYINNQIKYLSTANGYKSFGSFHSDDVEVLIRQDPNTYVKPELPSVMQHEYDKLIRYVHNEKLSFGKSSKQLFLLDNEFTFINHGAFGGTLSLCNAYANAWRAYCEMQPLRFYDRDLLPLLVYSYRMFGNFINCNPEHLVLIPNATYGMNSIVRSLIQTENDDVLILDIAYGAVKKIVETVCKDRGSTFDVIEIPLNTPMKTNEELLDDQKFIDFEANLLNALDMAIEPRHKLIIFDHTTSNTGINLPIKKMSKICKKYGGKIVIDGAHGTLAQSLDINNLFHNHHVDFYVGNCHKWLCSSKGLGFMCVKDIDHKSKNNIEIVPRVISHGYGDGFLSNYIWDGCRDYSSILALPLLLEFWNSYNLTSIRQYQHDTLKDGIELLLFTMWYDKKHHHVIDKNMVVPFSFHSPMALIKLPDKFQVIDPSSKMYCNTSTNAKSVQDYLYYDKKIEVPIKNINNVLYSRLSCHIYNELDDYEAFGRAFL